jgi:CubicO group peptidase (beta-lactamase class C family)
MRRITRRACLKYIVLALTANSFPAVLHPFTVLATNLEKQPTPTEREISTIAEIARQFMDQYLAPGLSVAIARHGQFVYQYGFGYTDNTSGEQITPSHLFRIASVTKPITSVAIFSLIEQNRLRLNDLVFGSRGLLQFDYSDGKSYPELVDRITIYHLLTHTCGGWGNDADDPMFRHSAMNHKELITWTVQNKSLEDAPGSHYAYSNFGYCILGRVIEKLTGQSYIEFVQQAILKKCGIKTMQLAGNTIAERANNEVIYYGQNGSDPYDMNIIRMDSHGGWIATPSDLVKFAMHVDGFKITPNILSSTSIKIMTSASAANSRYACGWNVNKAPNWWHNGSLPGTTAIMVRTASGLCWAALTNTRTNGIELAIDEMMWKMVKAVPRWYA